MTPLRVNPPPFLDETLWNQYGVIDRFAIQWVPASAWIREYDYYFRVVNNAKEQKVDLVYTRSRGSAAVAALRGLPTIYEVHDIVEGLIGRLTIKIFLAAPGFRGIVAITHSLKMHYSNQFHIPDSVILVAPDGIDMERFDHKLTSCEAKKRLGIDHDHFTAGYAGSFYAGRGIELVVELARRCANIQFFLFGGDSESVSIWRQKATQDGLHNLTFTGFIPNAELPAYLTACDVLLMPYQYRVSVSEGGNTVAWMSPMKMFEYMAVGKPIISSDLPVLREILNEENAILCNPDDITSWQYALEKVKHDWLWSKALGARAKRDVQVYAWRQRIQKILSYFLSES